MDDSGTHGRIGLGGPRPDAERGRLRPIRRTHIEHVGDTAARLLDTSRGDLRRLREEARRQPRAERKLLKQFKGIGDVGVDILFRDVQREWAELRSFADRRALAASAQPGLGRDEKAIERMTPGEDFVRLVNALVRVDLDGTADETRRSAR